MKRLGHVLAQCNDENACALLIANAYINGIITYDQCLDLCYRHGIEDIFRYWKQIIVP